MKYWRIVVLVVFVLSVCLTIGGSTYLIIHNDYIDQFQPHSYYGLLVTAFLAASPLPVFIPNSVVIFVLGTLFNPWLVALVSCAGNVAGTSLTWVAGHAGNRVVTTLMELDNTEEQQIEGRFGRLVRRIRETRWFAAIHRRRLLALFFASCIVTPLLKPTLLGLGASRANPWKVVLTALAGHAVQAVTLAWCGQLGLRAILNVFGVFGGG